jgi:hypothetical protein
MLRNRLKQLIVTQFFHVSATFFGYDEKNISVE